MPKKPKKEQSQRKAIRSHRVTELFFSRPPWDKGLTYVKDCDALFVLTEAGYWKMVDDRDMAAEVYKFLAKDIWQYLEDDEAPPNSNVATAEEVIKASRLWATSRVKSLPDRYIAFKDAVLDTVTLEKMPLDPSKYQAILHFDFDIADIEKYENLPETSTAYKFFTSSLVDEDTGATDHALISVIQEFIGLCLYPTNPPEAALFNYSPTGANGKGTFCNLLTDIFGEDFATAFSISQLTSNNFNLPELVGKRVNVNTEEPGKYEQVELFKSLVTGDRMQAARKFGHAFKLRPRAKFIFSLNEIPTFSSFSGPVSRRVIVVPWWRHFEKKDRDYGLEDKLKAEIPIIIAWAIHGLRRLKANSWEFTASKAVESMKRAVEIEASTALRFIEEQFEVETSDLYFIDNETLFEQYKVMADKGRYKAMSNKRFFMELAKKYGPVKIKKILGKTVRGRFLKSKDDAPPTLFPDREYKTDPFEQFIKD